MGKTIFLFFAIFFNYGVFSHETEILLTDELYYQMPDYLTLDNYEKCLSQKDGIYCYASFIIKEPENTSLVYNIIKKFSENPSRNLNHSVIHRGVCIGHLGTCQLSKTEDNVFALHKCVDDDLKKRYDLNVEIEKIHFCRSSENGRKMDSLDVFFIIYVTIIACLILTATFYDAIAKDEMSGGNKWILCFSLRENFRKLTKSEGDNEFQSFHGLRGIMSLLVQLSHAPLAMNCLAANPRFMETAADKWELVIFYNGPILIQVFIVVSAFLRANKIVSDPKQAELPMTTIILKALIERVIRISPMYITALLYSSTFAAYASDGPVWTKFVEGEADVCRSSFWGHVLFYQNFRSPRCLGTAWYLSLDLQIYIICTIIMTLTLKLKKNIYSVLFKILLLSIVMLFIIIHTLDLEPSMKYATPENLYNLFDNVRSFILLYQTTWGNLPSAVVGLIAGTIYTERNKLQFDIKEFKLFSLLCRYAGILSLLYLFGGYFVINAINSRLIMSIYATFDKIGFAVVLVFLIFGCLFYKDLPYVKFLEWSGWTILSRLSLASLLVHSIVNRAIVSSRIFPSTLSNLSVISDWFATAAITFLISVPLTLAVEYPIANLYRTVMAQPHRGSINKSKTVPRADFDKKQ